jgi:hypothetical protein
MWIIFILFILVLCAILIWIVNRNRSDAPTITNITNRPARSAYHCVTIHFESDACNLVKALEGKRLLADKAYGLPIQGCNAKKCRCRYLHHSDRRHQERRTLSYLHQLTNTASFQVRKRERRLAS